MQNGITRLYNAIWYTQVGRALEQAEQFTDYDEMFEENNDDIIHHYDQSDTHKVIPEAIRGAYEDIIRDKQSNIQRYKQAIGQLIALVEQKKSSLKGLTKDIDKLEKMKAGAIAKTKSTAAELQQAGTLEEEIKQHPDYVRCVTSYNDYHATVVEKNALIEKLEQGIERAQADIDNHKNQISVLHCDLEKIKTEKSEAVADLIEAREREEINNMLSGNSAEDTSAELMRIREIKEKAMGRS